MAFTNEDIKAPAYGKPHLVFVLGWWRVSPMPPGRYDLAVVVVRWRMAHQWAHYQNALIQIKLLDETK